MMKTENMKSKRHRLLNNNAIRHHYFLHIKRNSRKSLMNTERGFAMNRIACRRSNSAAYSSNPLASGEN